MLRTYGPTCERFHSATKAFDLIVNLFTSFGYFEDDQEHARVLSCVCAATRRGGTFVIDFLNAGHVRRELVPYDERVENGITIEQTRKISPDDRFVEKRIKLRGRGKEYIERVRLLSRRISSECSPTRGSMSRSVSEITMARFGPRIPPARYFSPAADESPNCKPACHGQSTRRSGGSR